ncbi:nitrate- and nitrite sensing domain-containing protein [Nocardiopsis sp. HNM0947]|uniref:histidine kinase n=1 Tax=Nocardiopsis coralli TaxID=2772213 RepID=A0ABR9PED9_9ACTN|nr:nitrate- and nitrite sensing domain-containing protein [Nocardiopsis coralli]MBE3002216.1 nitrate- and nitrite sensing domain-containing protein [Nocardiopsis coralli]
MGQSGGTRRGIGTQLKKIVLIPSITFLVLFVVLSAGTLTQALSLRSASSEADAGVELARALTDLQDERRLHAEYAADPGADRGTALDEAAESTDRSLDTVRSLRESLGDQSDPVTGELTGGFFEALDEVEELRGTDLSTPGDADTVLNTYSSAIREGVRLYSSITRTLDDGPAAAEAAATTDLMWAQESFGHADALVSAVFAGQELTRSEQNRIAALTTDARHRVATVHPGSETADGPTPGDLLAGTPWQDALEAADTLAGHEPEVTVDPLTGEQESDLAPPGEPGDWREAADPVNADLAEITHARAESVVGTTDSAAGWMMSLSIGGGILSLFAGALAYGVAARSASRLTFRLAKLRAETLGSARKDLPRIVRRLEAGEKVDLDTELHQLDHGTDEVGQVADAFNTAQRTAVGAAVKQADLREGVNRVFLGIAHRNQSLVQRQLQLLDRVEREEDDPDLLESLFQLDHLATRGRRHAENLIILGGAQPGRRWRHPIPLVDILRGAISESDEYARVRLTTIPDLSLSGAVVADVIHMLAELVENATAYSPPHTEVTIATETVPKGVVVEIEDRGLGMTEDALTRANTTLAEAPEFDVMAAGVDARLGLFVVARLAAKHDIAVELRPSPYGGTRAVVLVPGDLIAPTAGAVPERPRLGGAARRSRQPATTPEPESADLLASVGGRGGRAVLRPVPEPEEEGGQQTSSAPVLRRVPDPSPGQSPAPEQHSAASPLPRRLDDRVGTGQGRAGLPRRKRQASLAPQLRREPVREPEQPEEERAAPTQRSPEEVRRMMDAFSSGTRRGRAEQVEAAGDGRSSDGQVGGYVDEHTGESD